MWNRCTLLTLAGLFLGPAAPAFAQTTITVPIGTHRIALSGDGKYAAGIADNIGGDGFIGSKHLVVWNVTDRKETSKSTENGLPNVLALSFDGQQLAADALQRLTVRNAQTGKLTHTFKGFRGFVRQLAFSRDGTLLVSLSTEMEKSDLCLWDLKAGKLMAKLPTEDTLPIKAFALSADAKTLVIYAAPFGFKGIAQVWDVASTKQLRQVADGENWTDQVALSPDGKTLAYRKGLDLRLCDVETGKPQKTGKESIQHFTFSENGKHILGLRSTSGGSDLILIEVATGKRTSSLLVKHHLAAQFAFSAPGRRLAVLDQDLKGMDVLRIWDLDPLLPADARPPVEPGDPTKTVSLLIPRPGATLPNGNKQGDQVRMWDFSWKPVAGAQEYQLVVEGPTAKRPLIDMKTKETTFRKTFGGYIAPANLRSWRWKVRPLLNGEWGPWSEERTFDVAPVSSPKLPKKKTSQE